MKITLRTNKGGKLRRDTPLTCPPRLEGTVKNAMMNTVRKPKVLRQEPRHSRKARWLTEEQRKNYQPMRLTSASVDELPTRSGRR